MSRLEEIRELYAYNRWANARVFDAVAELTPAELEQEIVSSFPSVLATLTHMVGAEWLWASRLEGVSLHAMPAELAAATADALREWLATVQARQEAILAALTEEQLDDFLAYTDMSGKAHNNPYGAILRHVVNHATYHRGQITTMLRQLGRTPPTTDLIVYYRELVRV